MEWSGNAMARIEGWMWSFVKVEVGMDEAGKLRELDAALGLGIAEPSAVNQVRLCAHQSLV